HVLDLLGIAEIGRLEHAGGIDDRVMEPLPAAHADQRRSAEVLEDAELLALRDFEDGHRHPALPAGDDQLLRLAAEEEVAALVLVEAVVFVHPSREPVLPGALPAALASGLRVERRRAGALLHGAAEAEREGLVHPALLQLVGSDARR